MLFRFLKATVICLAISACGEPAGPEDSGPIPAVVLHVVDTYGKPVQGLDLRATIWMVGGPGSLQGQLDDTVLGEYRYQNELLRATRHDSLVVRFNTDPCATADSWSQTIVPLQSNPVQSIEVHFPRTRPRPLLAKGTEGCGLGLPAPYDGHPFFGSWWFEFVIDSAGPIISGRWRIHYQQTRRSEQGSFSGERVGAQAQLFAEPDSSIHYFGCDPRYTIVMDILPSGEIGTIRLEPRGGCIVPTNYFQPSAVDIPGFPW
jgi:hypothetical protein